MPSFSAHLQNSRFQRIREVAKMTKRKASPADLASSLAKGDRAVALEGHSAKVHSVAWSCDGRRLASGSYDRTVVVHCLEKFARETIFKGHTSQVDQLTWHATNSDLLASASGDKTVRLWDARCRKSVGKIETKGENINIAWSPDGDLIAVGNKDDVVQVIDARAQSVLHSEPFKTEVNELAWDRHRRLFLTTGMGQVDILSYSANPPSLTRDLSLLAHPSNIICIAFDPTGKYFAVGATDALVSLWDVANLVCVRTVSRLDWPIRAVSFSFDGRLLASGSEDLCIDIADTDTGSKMYEVKNEHPSLTLAWHPSQYILAYACDEKPSSSSRSIDGGVKVWGVVKD